MNKEHKESNLPNRGIDHRSIGGLLFNESEHSYINADGVQYKGMTTFLKDFYSPFNAEETARYKAIKEVLSDVDLKKLKKFITSKLSVDSRQAWSKVHLFYEKLCNKSESLNENLTSKKQEFLDLWDKNSRDGSIEHDLREKHIIENGITWNGKYYPYKNKTILDITKDDVCVIPEIMVWNHKKELCGLIDLPIFDNGIIHILDYKTNKKIEKSAFMNKKMFGPFRNHPDCNFYKYSAQLHGYMKMACELSGLEKGECWIISTASKQYKRKEDIYIECADMSKEINEAFRTYNK